MKNVLKYLLALVFLISCSSLCCCSGNENTSLKNGFEINGEEPIPAIFCAYTTDKTNFNINAIQFMLYYGTTKLDEQNFDENANYSAQIVLENENGENVVLKSINDFFSNKFKCTLTYDEKKNINTIDFNYCENIQIPSTLISSDVGYINISVNELIHRADGHDPEKGESSGIRIYYQTQKEFITLSSTCFE